MTRRRSTSAAAVLTAVLLAAGAPAFAASDANNAFDVRLKVKGFHLASTACADVPFTVTHDAGYLDRFVAAVEVRKGTVYVRRTFDYVYDSTGPLQASYFFCPHVEDLGTYRLGPSAIEWNDYDADEGGKFTDHSKAEFRLLQATKFSKVEIRRRGARRTVSGRARFFSVEAAGWRRFAKGTVIRLQRHRSDGSWTTVARNGTDARGRVTLSVRAADTSEYRLKSVATAQSWSARSRTLTS